MTDLRYSRILSQAFENHLVGNGALSILVKDPTLWSHSDRFAFDVHVREGDVITLYHGTTKLLDAHYDSRQDQVVFSASRSYSSVDGYQDLMRTWAPHELTSAERLHEVLSGYLSAASEKANDRYYRNKKEGFWQNRVSLAFGRMCHADAEWLVIDREAEVGFPSEVARQLFQEPIQEKYASIKTQVISSQGWSRGAAGARGFGNQCDFLAIGREDNLYCIELKHGSDAAKITFGPLQVAVYRDIFSKALPAITEEIKALVLQKVKVGLLPKDAVARLPKGNFRSVVPVLAVAVPNPNSSCWNRLKVVMDYLPQGSVRLLEIRDESSPVTVSYP